MSIKRIFIVISAIFAVSAVFADNSSVTSKKYVDDLMSGYQGKLPGSGANTLMIYDDETGIGEKSIETTLVSNATGVPTVGAVKTGLDGKQDTITGTAGYVMTGTGTPGDVGERAIYSANTNYTDSLVTAETVNSGVINAVNSSLIRVDENGDPSDSGTLWEINTSLFALSTQPLPAGYTQLEYIESDGTQFIDTGYSLAGTDVVEVKYSNVTREANSHMLFGFYGSGSRFAFNFYEVGSTSGYYYYGPSQQSIPTLPTDDGLAHVIKMGNGSLYYDNVLQKSGMDSNFSTSQSMFIFNSSGTMSYTLKARVHYARIYDANGTLIRNFVPAKNASNVVGMYDTVSGRFFPDAAGGNFTAGPSCISPNLFNKNGTLLNGTYNYNNGSWISNVGFRTQDNIPAKPNMRYTVSVSNLKNGANAFSLQAWDSSHQWLGVVAFDTNSSGSQTVITGTTPENTAFVSVSFAIEFRDIDTLQVETGSTATEYRPYGENICD